MILKNKNDDIRVNKFLKTIFFMIVSFAISFIKICFRLTAFSLKLIWNLVVIIFTIVLIVDC